MKRTTISGWVLALTLTVALAPLAAEDKKANELLESGLTKETIQGDLKGAIALYEQAVKEAGSNRALAAKAQLRLGAAYQKQGDEQARAVYERIVRDYADQQAAVSEARSRLGAMSGANSAVSNGVIEYPLGVVPKPGGPIIKNKETFFTEFSIPIPSQRQITLFNRQGKLLGTVGDPGPIGTMTISPDGNRVALVRDGAILIFDVKTQSSIKLTNGPQDSQPAWSADGKRIAYEVRTGTPGRERGIYIKSSDGSGKEELAAPLTNLTLVSWSPDGKYLTYQQNGPSTGADLWILPLNDGHRTPVPVLATVAEEMGIRISPDGRYYSYRVTEGNRSDVYVRPFPQDPQPRSDEKWKVSVDPGVARAGVRWRADGKEMYYLDANGGINAVEVTTTPTFKAGTPKVLFRVPAAFQAATDTSAGLSDVTADGQTFALMVPVK